MNEDRFWQMIDSAWKASPENVEFRRRLEATIGDERKRESFVDRYFDEQNLGMIPLEERLLDALRSQLETLSQEDLIAFDRILERALYEIDREDVHASTDGSDDGFLYCRGFIVACGRPFYDAVNGDPENALCDFECEEMCYLPHEIYEERFEGDLPDTDISRESCSNATAWPSLKD